MQNRFFYQCILTLCGMMLILPVTVFCAGTIPDTGQVKCYDGSGAEITCPSAGSAFHGQDAQYVRGRSYTVIQAGKVIQDDVTKLMWEVKTTDGLTHDMDKKYTWDDSNATFINTLNTDVFGGYNDWRLPTIKELASLVDLGKGTTPRIDIISFPNTATYYWSSTINANKTDEALYVNFFYGETGTILQSTPLRVRAVRDGQ